MELISVHIPKTAGVTFRSLLHSMYGKAAVRLDYGDRVLDPASTFQTDRSAWQAEAHREVASLPGTVRVVHGHFCAEKYADAFPEARWIVWLREPVARLVSHYHYWRNLSPTSHTLHRRLLDERLSLLEFARLPAMQNILADVFLGGLPLERFAFVGVQEHFAADLERLARRMGWTLPPVVGEENRNARPDYQTRLPGPGERAEIAALNAADVALYRRACERRTA